jgi:hypothetical protein
LSKPEVITIWVKNKGTVFSRIAQYTSATFHEDVGIVTFFNINVHLIRK